MKDSLSSCDGWDIESFTMKPRIAKGLGAMTAEDLEWPDQWYWTHGQYKLNFRYNDTMKEHRWRSPWDVFQKKRTTSQDDGVRAINAANFKKYFPSGWDFEKKGACLLYTSDAADE